MSNYAKRRREYLQQKKKERRRAIATGLVIVLVISAFIPLFLYQPTDNNTDTNTSPMDYLDNPISSQEIMGPGTYTVDENGNLIQVSDEEPSSMIEEINNE